MPALRVPDADPAAEPVPEPVATAVLITVARPPVAFPPIPVILPVAPIPLAMGNTAPTHVTPGASSDVMSSDVDAVVEAVEIVDAVTIAVAEVVTVAVAETITVANVGEGVELVTADVTVVATSSTSVVLPPPLATCLLSFRPPPPTVTIVTRALPASASKLSANRLKLASTLLNPSGTAGGGLAPGGNGTTLGVMGKGRTRVPVPAVAARASPRMVGWEVVRAAGGSTRMPVPAEALAVGSTGGGVKVRVRMEVVGAVRRVPAQQRVAKGVPVGQPEGVVEAVAVDCARMVVGRMVARSSARSAWSRRMVRGEDFEFSIGRG